MTNLERKSNYQYEIIIVFCEFCFILHSLNIGQHSFQYASGTSTQIDVKTLGHASHLCTYFCAVVASR